MATSAARTPDEVHADLLAEARQLLAAGSSDEPPPGESTTTLLVCPHVAEWAYFDEFHRFYSERLGNGDALMKEFGLKVVAFHPDCESSGQGLQAGDEVAVQGPDGALLMGTVLNAEAGTDEDGVDMLVVELVGTILEDREGADGADLLAVQPLPGGEQTERVRLSDVVWQLSSSSGREEGVLNLENPSDCRSLVARSPRPLLHLLRASDLAEVGDERREGVLARNELTVRELGVAGVEALIRACS